MKVYVVLPAYNEAARVGQVLDDLAAEGFRDLLVCDDGSTDSTGAIALARGACVVRHAINRGAGAATRTAVEVALTLGAEVIVLMDADGQHLARDVHKLLAALAAERVDVVIGNRMHDRRGMPRARVVFNLAGTLLTRLLGGVGVQDSQSGFRALTARAARRLDLRANGYEYCSEMLREIRRERLAWAEVPVSVVYDRGSRAKGQSLAHGLVTAWRLLLRAIR